MLKHFYPLSYDGHTKNKSENTRMLNYFNYDFITPKGKLKNSCYTIFGEGISQKLFSIFSILKKALKFILKPLFAYKELTLPSKSSILINMNSKQTMNHAADNIRILAASMVEKAKSGHPGGADCSLQ